MVDALTRRGDEGRSKAAISSGEAPSNLWSGDLRMGKPLVHCTRRAKHKEQLTI